MHLEDGAIGLVLNDKGAPTRLDHVHMEEERILDVERYVFERELLRASNRRVLEAQHWHYDFVPVVCIVRIFFLLDSSLLFIIHLLSILSILSDTCLSDKPIFHGCSDKVWPVLVMLFQEC